MRWWRIMKLFFKVNEEENILNKSIGNKNSRFCIIYNVYNLYSKLD